eukprot:CAMPEP_0174310392 /NCGR_PEP_ID=MMETSP0810-20121108/3019_1 /TAXON_ID=73025 ORGANISM="Eutreptiella gymnastica-like, Strain CCMP1594" /NCGR_SAMPLE_ID=MMETSP0810 /ASSEMBLY_ACC=CAM_ASM_000659 /LENGTH=108 /DNA_ID=CAMNT_0015418289 /DNA_START=1778 /DNA_END=2101 /DNA_ORIENTATION=+
MQYLGISWELLQRHILHDLRRALPLPPRSDDDELVAGDGVQRPGDHRPRRLDDGGQGVHHDAPGALRVVGGEHGVRELEEGQEVGDRRVGPALAPAHVDEDRELGQVG